MTILLHVVFMKVVDLTMSASVLVLVLLCLRRFGGKLISPRVMRWLWFVLLIKLAVPLNIPSPYSIENWTDPLFYHHPYSISGALSAAGDGWNEVRQAWGSQRRSGDVIPASAQGQDVATKDDLYGEPDSAFSELRGQIEGMQDILTGAGSVWLGGCLLSLAISAFKGRKARRMYARGIPCEDPQALALLDRCKEEAEVGRAVRLMVSGTISPVLYGLFKPRILLPYEYRSLYEPDELRHILLHELSHVRQHDIAIYRLSGLLQALHWFNPFLHLAMAKLRDDMEISCDSRVLRRMSDEEGLRYGLLLIKQGELNRRFTPPDRASAGWFAGHTQLKERILKIAGEASMKRKKWSSAAAIGILLLMYGCFVPGTGTSVHTEAETQPTLYAFWLAGDANPQSMAVIESISNQMTGMTGPDRQTIMLLKEGIAQPAFRQVMNKLWLMTELSPEQPVVIRTDRIQEELGKRGLKTGKLYVTLKYEYTYIKAFTIGLGRSTLVSLSDSALGDEIEL